MVIAATSDTDLNVGVFHDAEARQMLVNVVDVPPLCNFILPAIVRSGPIAIAISTSGASPALAKRLKREIAEQFGDSHARLAEILNELRGWAKDTFDTYEERRDFFEDIVNGTPDPIALLRAGDETAVRELIRNRQSPRLLLPDSQVSPYPVSRHRTGEILMATTAHTQIDRDRIGELAAREEKQLNAETQGSGAMFERARKTLSSAAWPRPTRSAIRGRSTSTAGRGLAGLGRRRQRDDRLPQRLRLDGAGPRPPGHHEGRARSGSRKGTHFAAPTEDAIVVGEELARRFGPAALALRQLGLRGDDGRDPDRPRPSPAATRSSRSSAPTTATTTT